jgi:hypothetical protein
MAAINERPVRRAFFLFSSSAINIEAIKRIKIAKAQGLMESTAAAETTAKVVGFKLKTGAQVSFWARAGLIANSKLQMANSGIINSRLFFIFE